MIGREYNRGLVLEAMRRGMGQVAPLCGAVVDVDFTNSLFVERVIITVI